MKKIVLSRNDFSGTIPELSKNTKLEYFYLSNNVLTGKIPPTLSALSHLKWLSLGENKLDGTVPSLEKLSHLKVYSLITQHLSHFDTLFSLADDQYG